MGRSRRPRRRPPATGSRPIRSTVRESQKTVPECVAPTATESDPDRRFRAHLTAGVSGCYIDGDRG
jgi:hypothetical protein